MPKFGSPVTRCDSLISSNVPGVQHANDAIKFPFRWVQRSTFLVHTFAHNHQFHSRVHTRIMSSESPRTRPTTNEMAMMVTTTIVAPTGNNDESSRCRRVSSPRVSFFLHLFTILTYSFHYLDFTSCMATWQSGLHATILLKDGRAGLETSNDWAVVMFFFFLFFTFAN